MGEVVGLLCPLNTTTVDYWQYKWYRYRYRLRRINRDTTNHYRMRHSRNTDDVLLQSPRYSITPFLFIVPVKLKHHHQTWFLNATVFQATAPNFAQHIIMSAVGSTCGEDWNKSLDEPLLSELFQSVQCPHWTSTTRLKRFGSDQQ